MKKVFSRIIMLLIFAAFLLPKSYAQTVGFYPKADTVYIGWGCTVPLILCSVQPGPFSQDSIIIAPSWNTWMWIKDTLGHRYDIPFGYFLVEGSVGQFEYELWYIPKDPWIPISLIPFDSDFGCEAYLADIQLKSKQDTVLVASLSQFFVSDYGLAVEPDLSRSNIPVSLEVAQNFPNPFNSATQIEVGLPEAGSIRIEIFNALGQRVYAEQSRTLAAGYHLFYWDGQTAAGQDVSSGVYFCKISMGRQIAVRKMALLR